MASIAEVDAAVRSVLLLGHEQGNGDEQAANRFPISEQARGGWGGVFDAPVWGARGFADSAPATLLQPEGTRDHSRPVAAARANGNVFAGRLLALRHVEALAPTEREVRVAPGTVVTPLARDLLKQRGIALRQVAAGEAERVSRSGEWGFAIDDEAGALGTVAALRRALLEEAWSELERAPGAAAHWVAEAAHRGALLLTAEASVAVWRACQVSGVRAAAADDPEAVARAVRHLGVNLLVVEPLGKSISWIRRLGATFRSAGAPVRPMGIDDRKEACRCGSPR
jgi:hypothetical protein